jgi:uncharacterized repeat protein (TIGR03803 family)
VRKKSLGIPIVAIAMFAAIFLVTGTRAVAQQEKVLHTFIDNGQQGYAPSGNLVFDNAGNLYGTTCCGGVYASAGGTVFELTPQAGGGWTGKTLHSFGSGNGAYGPLAGLTIDAAGNLYGTAYYHGGSVFELSPTAGGGWILKTLHAFNINGAGGSAPHSVPIFDAAGNLYGTATSGGTGNGTVFELTPTATGTWTETVLHKFRSKPDGASPNSLIFDGNGNLYGTTGVGGAYEKGTVFELTPVAGGGWTESILHSFGAGTDGANPLSLVFDGAGNLYGTTLQGGNGACSYGANGCGTVFELSPQTGGAWTETILLNFSTDGTEGWEPFAGLTFDAAGNLYGTTGWGGVYTYGTAFKLSPQGGGAWTETVLHNFGNGSDGEVPGSGLIFDAAGNLYGATGAGGIHNDGTVFEIAY